MKKIRLLLLLFTLVLSVSGQTKKPEPVVPLPTAAQLNWQQAELVAVFHYDLHVFDGAKYNQAYNRVMPIKNMEVIFKDDFSLLKMGDPDGQYYMPAITLLLF